MIVLDTQAWLWWLHAPEKIPARTRKLVQQGEAATKLLVSSISVWEIATKNRLGKLSLPMDMRNWFAAARAYPGIAIEPLAADDAIASTELPEPFHKDPADRIIVAMARRYGALLVTSDEKIRAYRHVRTSW
ncbi:MAG: type II toxin-antitoxin system VapC family toxin [Burkholderiales bacterium]|nr:type II toxin-antitoxin system VapC family toxin [Burkholderiales bacterium]